MTRLSVTLTAADAAPGTAAVGEVADEDRRGADPIVLVTGEPTELDVAPGGYFVSARLPSGERGDAWVLVEGDEPVQVEVLAGPAPVSGRWAVVDRLRARLDALSAPSVSRVSATLWSLRGESWWPGEDLRLSESESTSVRVPGGVQSALRYDAPAGGQTLIVLPMAAAGHVRVGPLKAHPDGTPDVTLASPIAETLAAYLDGSRLAAAGSLVDYLLQKPGLRMGGDPSLETLIGYHLLRTGDDERLGGWSRLPRTGAGCADQLVIDGRRLLRAQHESAARETLVRAAAVGPPAYRDGLRLLVDGLRRFTAPRAAEEDAEARAALDRMEAYALGVDPDARLTAFPGRHPQEPEPPREQPAVWTSTSRLATPSLSERRLRVLLVAHAAWSAALAVTYLAGGDTGTAAFIPNSFAQAVLFAVLSALGAADVRRFGWLAFVIASGYVALAAGHIATLAWGGATVHGTTLLAAWLVADVGLALVFAILGNAAIRAAKELRALSPLAFSGIAAFAEVLVDAENDPSPEDVAHNVDAYLAQLRSPVKGQMQVALTYLTLAPLLFLRPPLPALSRETRRRFLDRNLMGRSRLQGPLGPLHRAVTRAGAQLTYLGYYGDRRVWRSLGYVPTDQRMPGPGEAPLRSLPVPPRGGRGRYDAVVIGSGAAGAVMAYRLAETGRRVLVLERGPHADPSSLPGDEASQYLRFYAQGALSVEPRLRLLQASCVGGGTTVGDGICLSPPRAVLNAWSERGIDAPALGMAVIEVQRWLRVAPVRSPAAPHRFVAGVGAASLPGYLAVVEAGSTSVLETLLPEAQQRFPGSLEVLADCEVEQIVHEGDRATHVTARWGHERLELPADEVVVAGGAIASSVLLRRSGLGGEGAGEGLHFNLRAALTAEFPEPVDAFAEAASHMYVAPGDPPAFLIETWPVRPVAQALALPGWFDEHTAAMHRYRHLMTAAVLVGSTTPGRVKVQSRGPLLEYEVSRADRSSLTTGLQTAARIFFAAGAIRVLPSTFAWCDLRSPGVVASVAAEDLLLTSAHPQGGNALGTVVDEDFRVRGTRNVYLCDASVFPTSVHVDPQITVMALARYAAARITGY